MEELTRYSVLIMVKKHENRSVLVFYIAMIIDIVITPAEKQTMQDRSDIFRMQT
jgi:hypothetical protein